MYFKRLTAIFTIITIVCCSMSISAQEQNYIDQYLLDAGFPTSVVETLSESKKEFIYEKTNNKNISFCNYETKGFNINDDGALSENIASPCGGLLNSSEITVDVIGIIADTSEGIEYSVFPSFTWHVVKKVKNDSFSMSMYPGWEVVPGERNLRLYFINNQGNSVYTDLDCTDSTSSGYTFKIPSSVGANQGYYEGHAYFDVEKTSTSASNRISLHYTHDASTSMNVSYSINLGIASISLSGNTDPLYVFADNFNIDFM